MVGRLYFCEFFEKREGDGVGADESKSSYIRSNHD